MSAVTTSGKGKVLIHKRERKMMGIKPGKKLTVESVDDHIGTPPLPDNPVEYFCGIFKEGTSLTKALIKARKEELKQKG